MNKAVKAFALLLAIVFIVGAFNGCKATKLEAVMKSIEGNAYDFNDENGVSVHDPSLFRAEDGTYYVTGSHIASAKSTDLINWNTISAGVYDSNRTLVKEGSTLREVLNKAFAWCDAAQTLWLTEEENWQTNVWASTVIYNKAMGKYCYYACTSVWGTPMSVIWLAVSDDPEGTFEFVDTVVYSGFNNCLDEHKKPLNQLHYSNTNIADLIRKGTFTKKEINAQPWFDEWGNYDCSYGKYPNAIDPALFYDKDGNLWLTYGSFSGGIYIMPIVEETGLPDYKKMRDTEGYDIYFGKQISCTNEETENTGEGPFIVYDKQSGYYYLFLTYGGLSALEGYNIREYRSENPDGPYLDAAGNDACDMKSTGTKIIPNYQFSADETAYLAAGHSSCLIDDDGKIYQAYHQRYNDGWGGFFNVQIHQMLRTANGWLTVLPTAYNGETATAVTLAEIAGEYEMILYSSETKKTDDWSKVADIIEPTVAAVIDENGKLTVDGKAGTVAIDNASYTFTLELDGVTYYGAFCIGTQNGKSVMTMSAMSETNQTIWAIRK